MRVRRTSLAAVATTALLAGMTGVAHGQTITAIGVAQVKVVAPAPLTNAKIVRAVAVARKAAIPQAFAAAQAQATRLALASGLQPGAILAVEETAASPFGGFYYGTPALGRFGPNDYCGPVQTARRAPRQADGRRGRIISRRTITRCFKPTVVGMSISVTYDATPVPAVPAA